MLQQGYAPNTVSEAEISDDDLDSVQWNSKKIRIFRPEKSFARPIMLMFSGSARCINRHFPVSFVAKRLATGSIFGESDAMKLIGIDFFGDIYAETKGLTCLIIEKPDLVLDIFEIKILKEVLGM